jgi:hypothetical protein
VTLPKNAATTAGSTSMISLGTTRTDIDTCVALL